MTERLARYEELLKRARLNVLLLRREILRVERAMGKGLPPLDIEPWRVEVLDMRRIEKVILGLIELEKNRTQT